MDLKHGMIARLGTSLVEVIHPTWESDASGSPRRAWVVRPLEGTDAERFTITADRLAVAWTKRFCDAGCHASWKCDGDHGIIRHTRLFAAYGCCSYCGEYVPTNIERAKEAAA